METPDASQTQLLDLNKSGTAVPKRIATASQAQDISNRLIRDDLIRANRRLQVQGQYNGNAPKTRQAMKNAGRENDSNLNWRENKARIIDAWTPFFDLVCEVPVCIDGDLEIGDPTQDADLMRGIAEKFHNMVFGWKGFDDMNQLCDLQMLLHGNGLLVWEDEWTWFPKPVLASNFYIPDETLSSLENCEEFMVTRNYTAGELWRHIADPEKAKAMGWSPGPVKNAIMNSANAAAIQAYGKIWDRWEQAFKNGDLYMTQTQTKQIPLSTIWVQEMDGTISQMIVEQSPGGSQTSNSEFLYYAQSKYENWDQALVVFPYDIGADGTFHSVKGMGTEIFPYCELLNKIKNTLADLAVTWIKPMWQPATGGDIEKFQMVKWGGGNLVPGGFSPVEMDISRGMQPALEISREFSSSLASNTGGYGQTDLAQPTVEETAKAATIRAAERAKLTKGAFNRYMRGKDRQYSEMFRRASNPKLRDHHPNSKAALKFQNECKRLCAQMQVPWEMDVPAEFSPTGKAGKFTVLQMVQNVRATRAFGLGSPAMRMEIAAQMMANIDRYDQIGQNEILRFFTAAMTGYHTVDAIVPSLANSRDRVNDESVAANEDNGFAMLGPDAEAFVLPGQNHVTHLSIHIPSMQKDMQECQQGMQDPRECAKRLEGKAPHAMQHLQVLKSNPTKQNEYKQFSQQFAEIASFQDHLEQMITEQNNEAAQQPQPGQPDSEMEKVRGNLQLKAEKDQGQLQLKAQQQQFNQQLKIQQQQFEQQMKAKEAAFEARIKDLLASADVRRENALAVHKARNGTEKTEKA